MIIIECGSSNETQLKFRYVWVMWNVLSLQRYRFFAAFDILMPSDARAKVLQEGGGVQLSATSFWLHFSICFKVSAPRTGETFSQMDTNLCNRSLPFSVYGTEQYWHICTSTVQKINKLYILQFT